jgi:hypothetical protein
MSESVDERLANIWNGTVAGQSAAYPEHMWDLCRILAQYNLVIGNRQDVAALEIGPFRAVSTMSQDDVLDIFIDSILPTIIAQYCLNQAVLQAVTGPLTFLTRVFCLSLRSSNFIKDQLAWSVLMSVKQANFDGKHPTKEEIIDIISNKCKEYENLENRVEDAIEILMNFKPILGNRPVVILSMDEEGGFVSSV